MDVSRRSSGMLLVGVLALLLLAGIARTLAQAQDVGHRALEERFRLGDDHADREVSATVESAQSAQSDLAMVRLSAQTVDPPSWRAWMHAQGPGAVAAVLS